MATDAEWTTFARRYKAEVAEPEARHDIALLAAPSQRTNFSVGFYCDNAARCHRSLLSGLLKEAGAVFSATPT